MVETKHSLLHGPAGPILLVLAHSVSTRNNVGSGGIRSFVGSVAEHGVRVFLEYALAFVTRAPLTVNTSRHGRPNEQVVTVAHVLYLVVMTDLFHVRPVVELATDTNQHYLSILQVLRMWTVHWPTRQATNRSINSLKMWYCRQNQSINFFNNNKKKNKNNTFCRKRHSAVASEA